MKVRSMVRQPKDVTSIELGDLNSENVTFKNSHKFSAMVSRFWSGTIRTDICDLTREGITVGSSRVQYSIRESGKVGNPLLGPDTWRLWTVNEGSRHLDDRDSVDRLVIEAIRSYSPDSSSVIGRTCSSSRL